MDGEACELGWTAAGTSDWGTDCRHAGELLADALNSRAPQIFDTTKVETRDASRLPDLAPGRCTMLTTGRKEVTPIAQVAGGEGHEVSYFARKRGNTKDQAERLIKRVGNNRAKSNAAAEKPRKQSGPMMNILPRMVPRSKDR
jgi:hypothetical protein